jgi:hypothetical protein
MLVNTLRSHLHSANAVSSLLVTRVTLTKVLKRQRLNRLLHGCGLASDFIFVPHHVSVVGFVFKWYTLYKENVECHTKHCSLRYYMPLAGIALVESYFGELSYETFSPEYFRVFLSFL